MYNNLLQISSLKSSSDKDRISHSDEIDRIRKEAETENHRLRQEILASAEEYSKKVATLQKLHEEKLKQLDADMQKTIMVKEDCIHIVSTVDTA